MLTLVSRQLHPLPAALTDEMPSLLLHISLLAGLLIKPAVSTFKLQSRHVGRDFLSDFHWETFDDPTHGRVNYVDQATALQRNLTYGA